MFVLRPSECFENCLIFKLISNRVVSIVSAHIDRIQSRAPGGYRTRRVGVSSTPPIPCHPTRSEYDTSARDNIEHV